MANPFENKPTPAAEEPQIEGKGDSDIERQTVNKPGVVKRTAGKMVGAFRSGLQELRSRREAGAEKRERVELTEDAEARKEMEEAGEEALAGAEAKEKADYAAAEKVYADSEFAKQFGSGELSPDAEKRARENLAAEFWYKKNPDFSVMRGDFMGPVSEPRMSGPEIEIDPIVKEAEDEVALEREIEGFSRAVHDAEKMAERGQKAQRDANIKAYVDTEMARRKEELGELTPEQTQLIRKTIAKGYQSKEEAEFAELKTEVQNSARDRKIEDVAKEAKRDKAWYQKGVDYWQGELNEAKTDAGKYAARLQLAKYQGGLDYFELEPERKKQREREEKVKQLTAEALSSEEERRKKMETPVEMSPELKAELDAFDKLMKEAAYKAEDEEMVRRKANLKRVASENLARMFADKVEPKDTLSAIEAMRRRIISENGYDPNTTVEEILSNTAKKTGKETPKTHTRTENADSEEERKETEKKAQKGRQTTLDQFIGDTKTGENRAEEPEPNKAKPEGRPEDAQKAEGEGQAGAKPETSKEGKTESGAGDTSTTAEKPESRGTEGASATATSTTEKPKPEKYISKEDVLSFINVLRMELKDLGLPESTGVEDVINFYAGNGKRGKRKLTKVYEEALSSGEIKPGMPASEVLRILRKKRQVAKSRTFFGKIAKFFGKDYPETVKRVDKVVASVFKTKEEKRTMREDEKLARLTEQAENVDPNIALKQLVVKYADRERLVDAKPGISVREVAEIADLNLKMRNASRVEVKEEPGAATSETQSTKT